MTEEKMRRNKNLRICIIRNNDYPEEPRLYKEVQALLEAGYKVDIICSKFNKKKKIYEKINNLRIFRIPIIHRRASIFRYLIEYTVLFISMTIMISLLFIKYNLQYMEDISLENIDKFRYTDNIFIVENLRNLGQIADRDFTFFAVPPKISKTAAFPVRAFAILGH